MNIVEAVSSLEAHQSNQISIVSSSQFGREYAPVFFVYQIVYSMTSGKKWFNFTECHGIASSGELITDEMIFQSAAELLEHVRLNDAYVMSLDFKRLPMVLDLSKGIETLRKELSDATSVAA